MRDIHVELADCQNTLLREIHDTKVKRKDVAMTYAMALRSSEAKDMDWERVNVAIMARWSLNALRWIKERAWAYAEGRRKFGT